MSLYAIAVGVRPSEWNTTHGDRGICLRARNDQIVQAIRRELHAHPDQTWEAIARKVGVTRATVARVIFKIQQDDARLRRWRDGV